MWKYLQSGAQEEFAIRSGLELRFVRELEQGKETDAGYSFVYDSEYLVMQMAEATGIKTVPYALIRMPPQEHRVSSSWTH